MHILRPSVSYTHHKDINTFVFKKIFEGTLTSFAFLDFVAHTETIQLLL